MAYRLTAETAGPKIDLLTLPGGDSVEGWWSPRGVYVVTGWMTDINIR